MQCPCWNRARIIMFLVPEISPVATEKGGQYRDRDLLVRTKLSEKGKSPYGNQATAKSLYLRSAGKSFLK